jgi:uncharacterized membrane protein
MVPARMSLYDWLLFFHITGAFLLIGGVVIAGLLNIAAIAVDRRPSQVAALYGLIRFAVPLIGAGMLLTLAIGLWLVHESPWGYGYGDTWVIVAIVLWLIAGWLGGMDGKYQRRTGELAARLAADGDARSEELDARLRNVRALAISYGSGLAAFAVLGIMIWKPGA